MVVDRDGSIAREGGGGSAPYSKPSRRSSVLNWGCLNPPGMGLVSSKEERNDGVSTFYCVIWQ